MGERDDDIEDVFDIDWKECVPSVGGEVVGELVRSTGVSDEDYSVEKLVGNIGAVGAEAILGDVADIENLKDGNITRFVVSMAGLGVSHSEIASMLDIDPAAFSKKFGSLCEQTENLRNAVVLNKVFHKAISGDKKFLELWAKAKCGMSPGGGKVAAGEERGKGGLAIYAGNAPTINVQVVKPEKK